MYIIPMCVRACHEDHVLMTTIRGNIGSVLQGMIKKRPVLLSGTEALHFTDFT